MCVCLFKMVIFYIVSLPEGIYTDILWLPMVQAVSSWYFFQSVHLFEHNPDSGLIELLCVSEPLETTQKALLYQWTSNPFEDWLMQFEKTENRTDKKINRTGMSNCPSFLPCRFGQNDAKCPSCWLFLTSAPWSPLPVFGQMACMLTLGCFWSGS